MKVTHEELAAVVGKNARSPEVKRLLAAVRAKRVPRLGKAGSEYLDQAYLALPKLGLQLSFDLPAHRKPSKANEEHLRVARIEFWARDSSKDMPTTFSGRLPFDITFSDDQKTVRKKIGSKRSGPRLRSSCDSATRAR